MKFILAWVFFLFGVPFWILGFLLHIPRDAFKAGNDDAKKFINWLGRE